DILFNLCEEVFAQLVESFQEIVRVTLDPVECLRKCLRSYIEFGLTHPGHYRLTFMTVWTPIIDLSDRMEESSGMKAFGNMGILIANCVKAGVFPDTDINIASEALWAAIHGVTSLLIVKTRFPWTDRERLIDTVIEQAIQGLRAG